MIMKKKQIWICLFLLFNKAWDVTLEIEEKKITHFFLEVTRIEIGWI